MLISVGWHISHLTLPYMWCDVDAIVRYVQSLQRFRWHIAHCNHSCDKVLELQSLMCLLPLEFTLGSAVPILHLTTWVIAVFNVTSPRWRHRGHEVAGEDSNFGEIHSKVAHFLQIKGAVRVRGTRRASDTAPHRRRALLLSLRRGGQNTDTRRALVSVMSFLIVIGHAECWMLQEWVHEGKDAPLLIG